MRWNLGLSYLAVLLGSVSGGIAADSSVIQDPETGFTFSEYAAAYAIGSSITFRIAIPSPATGAYDLVLQIVAPIAVGWTGIAWGGQMIYCPLTIGWLSGSTGVASVRRATSHTTPALYTGATLQVLRTGTKTNGTHWQITAKCSGCSSFVGSGTTNKTLNANGSNRLAFAYSKTKPSSSSSAATINVHDVYNYWDHDFASAGNANFAQLVQQNT
ncbi:hypothetical protein GGR57DRAFT_514067 [Xylariaceae sp. FL1272]|nr:hypothetical protein GGR57DRAFT_514067 [Xylariaceae sp. FL1272]